MGLFDFLIKLNNSFFDGLKKGAIDNAVKNSKKTETPKSPVIERMSELNKLAKELEDDLDYYGLSPEEERFLENQHKENMNNLISKLFVGMKYDELNEIKPPHDKKVSNVTNGKETLKLYYGKKENRLGNDSYEFEITLKEGLVIGWKDLSNVGKRNS